MWQDPQASGSFHPLPSLVWAGSVLQQLSCPRGWDKPALGKGMLGPWPPAPSPALLWNLMYLNTHTHTRKSSWPNPVLHPAKTNKQTNEQN